MNAATRVAYTDVVTLLNPAGRTVCFVLNDITRHVPAL